MAEITELQREYVTWNADPKREGSKQGWATAHNVSYETLRRWQKEDWYAVALEEELRERGLGMDSILDVVMAMKKKAAEGDTAAAKLYFQFIDRVQPMKQREVEDDLASLSDDALDALLEGAVD